MIVNGAIDDAVAFKGGWHWKSLVYALWEASLCVSTCIGLIYAFRRYLDRRAGWRGSWCPTPWAVVGAVAVPLCFGLSSLIRKLPYTDRVL